MEPKKPIKKNKADFVPLTLRLPPALHAGIVEQAAVAKNSLNEYIVNILSEYPGLKVERDKLRSDMNTVLTSLADIDRRMVALEARYEIRSRTPDNVRLDVTDSPPDKTKQ